MANFDIGSQITDLLEAEQKRIEKVAESTMEEAAKSAVTELRQSSPKKTGRYAKGWKVDKQKGTLGGTKYVVHNTNHRLTHLLNNGHVSANQFGTYSRRVPGDHHIDRAADKATNKLVQDLMSKIK